MRQVVLDTETTGLSWEKGNRVVEIGCIELVERRPTAAPSTATWTRSASSNPAPRKSPA